MQDTELASLSVEACHDAHLVVHEQGYLAAISASAYSYVSMVQHFGPLMNPGSAALSLTYLASERIIPGKVFWCKPFPIRFATALTGHCFGPAAHTCLPSRRLLSLASIYPMLLVYNTISQ